MEDHMVSSNYLIKEYLDQLSEREREMLNTAKEMLGSSFNIYKSIGFLEWKINK